MKTLSFAICIVAPLMLGGCSPWGLAGDAAFWVIEAGQSVFDGGPPTSAEIPKCNKDVTEARAKDPNAMPNIDCR